MAYPKKTPCKSGHYSECNNKAVVQLSLDGEYIQTFESMTAAAQAVGVFKSSIWAVCAGRKPICRGYRWMTLDRFNDAKRAEEHDRVKHSV